MLLRRFLSASIPGVLMLLIGGAGCIVIGSGNSPAPKCPPGAVAASPPGVDVCAVDPREYTVTIDEVNAAMRLGFDNMRVDQLKKIAARRGLTPAEQEYVACNALHRLGFDNMKVDVLKVLIDNPDFSYRAKGKILRHLNAIAFDNMRLEVMQAMEGKGDQPPPVPPVAPPAPASDKDAGASKES
jgi:hypothetical protein